MQRNATKLNFTTVAFMTISICNASRKGFHEDAYPMVYIGLHLKYKSCVNVYVSYASIEQLTSLHKSWLDVFMFEDCKLMSYSLL